MVGKTSLRKSMYTPIVLEATVAIPAVSIVQNSDGVILSRYGLTAVVDSIPTKMLLAAQRLSAPLIRMSRRNTHANNPIIRCMMPR